MLSPTESIPEVIVFSRSASPFLAERTRRAMIRLGVPATDVNELRDDMAADHGKTVRPLFAISGTRPLWLIQAGCWPSRRELKLPPASSTLKPLVAVGAIRTSAFDVQVSPQADEWTNVLKQSRGDLELFVRSGSFRLTPASYWIDSKLAVHVARELNEGCDVSDTVLRLMNDVQNRIVAWQGIDVCLDDRLRAVQIITSLQRGGAERIALGLNRTWQSRADVCPLLIALGPPSRTAFPTPNNCVVLPADGPRLMRAERAATLASSFQADIVHSHLLDRAELQHFAKVGLPHMATIHNARQGWTHQTDQLTHDDIDLLVGCSKAVEQDLRLSLNGVPIRTIWNGIDPQDVLSTNGIRNNCRSQIRRNLRIADNALVVVTVANVRPQKRMERLPAILRELQKLVSLEEPSREVHLIIAGELSSGNAMAQQSERLLQDAIETTQMARFVHWLGSVDDVRGLLASADVVVSTSDYEGLSLAHLEALAAGKPVIAYAVGGTAEIGGEADGMYLMETGASDQEFAGKVFAAIHRRPTESTISLKKRFTLNSMAQRYLSFYRRLAAKNRHGCRRGLLLVINNFSTGGAQSSARRLLKEFQRRGLHVRAAVLQETPERPSCGCSDLLLSRIPIAFVQTEGKEPSLAIQPLLTAVDRDPPEAIVLWNVMPSYKLALTDLLADYSVFDVSPGEMNFQSLESYFQAPRGERPYQTTTDYGRLLAGAVVKFHREQSLAEQRLQTKVHVIPNGVPVPERSVIHGPRDVVVFGTSTRISPQKKLEELLTAFRVAHSSLPYYELRIAGEAEFGSESYAASLRSLSEGLPVVWLGEVQAINSFLLELDVFVMISHPAGCPNASLEAMAVGLPVIATDHGGAHDQVIDGLTGYLVPDGDVDSFAAALCSLAANGEQRRSMGVQSRQRIEEHFLLEQMVDGYLAVFGLR